MIKAAAEATNGFIQRFAANPAVITSILIAIFGQVSASIYFQITNNERQEHAIESNNVAIKNLQESIVSMQTPLAGRVIKMEDRIEEGSNRIRAIQEENVRNFARIEEQQERMLAALDNLYTHVTGVPILKRNSQPVKPKP